LGTIKSQEVIVASTSHTDIIRHLSAAPESPFFLAAKFERQVYLFKVDQPDPLLEIGTHLDFGGHRLAIVPEKQVAVASAFYRYGIEAYSLKDAKLRWARKDLKKVQVIRKMPNGASILCFFADKAACRLDVTSGSTIETRRGLLDAYFSSEAELTLESPGRGDKYWIKTMDGQKLFPINKESFALLDVAFSPSHVAVTEPGNHLRVYSLNDGKLSGAYHPPKGYHVLSIAHLRPRNEFVCLVWGYQSRGDYFLIRISATGQTSDTIFTSSAYAACFFPERNSFLNATGQEVDVVTGSKIAQYNFPE
jgi:WD40 repeat protein